MNRIDRIKSFTQQTGATEDSAAHYLDAFSDDLSAAVECFKESLQNPANPPAAGVSGQSEDELRVAADAALAASLAQEAAESYEEEEVRAPIPRMFDRLLPPETPPYRVPRQSVDPFRNFENETREQEALLGVDGSAFSRGRSGQTAHTSKIDDLYKPPLDLIFKGSFIEARNKGQVDNKWLMVFISNDELLGSISLNKDLWAKSQVKEIVKEKFIFWMAEHQSFLAKYYLQFYPVTSYPHVAIIDSITGERKLVVEKEKLEWEAREGYLQIFLFDLRRFFRIEGVDPKEHEKKNNGLIKLDSDSDDEETRKSSKRKNSDAHDSLRKRMKKAEAKIGSFSDEEAPLTENGSKSVLDVTEEDQLKFAIQQSLKNNKSRSCSSDSEDDDFDVDPLANHSAVKRPSSQACSSKSLTSSSESSSSSATDSLSDETAVNWSDLVAPYSTSTKCTIVVRLPQGERDQLSIPSDAPVRLIKEYFKPKGYLPPLYKAFTSWPKKDIFAMNQSVTVKEAGIAARDTIILQRD